MPYEVVRDTNVCPVSKPWLVRNQNTHTRMGCHPSRSEAMQQLRALYVNEPGSYRSEDLTPSRVLALVGAAKYSPDQPRDEAGRFGEGGGGVPSRPDVGGRAYPDVTGANPDHAAEAFGGNGLKEMTDHLQQGITAVDVVPTLALTHMNGEADISFELRTPGGAKGDLMLSTLPNGNAKIDLMNVPSDLQGQGVAHDLMANFVNETSGTRDGIELDANINVGSYAWGKFGFVPDSLGSLGGDNLGWNQAGGVAARVESRLNDPAMQNRIPAASAAIVREAVKSDDPRSLWNITDAPGTFPLLDGQPFHGETAYDGGIRWHGTLDYHDSQAMDRFHSYVGR